MKNRITIGSMFSGIGGFELGLERAIPGAETIWQVEENKFCQGILKKHWPRAQIFDDVRTVGAHNLEPPTILCGGFPCTDLSIAGKREGINEGKKSSLWWEMWRVIGELRPKIVCIENVPGITFSNGGLADLLGSLAQIGYDAEWIDLRASDFSAPHKRERIFIISYPSLSISERTQISSPRHHHKSSHSLPGSRSEKWEINGKIESSHSHRCIKSLVPLHDRKNGSSLIPRSSESSRLTPHPGDSNSSQHPRRASSVESSVESQCRSSENGGLHQRNYWERFPTQHPLCHRNDGVSPRMARLTALGNAIVPQCSEWVGRRIYESGLLD